MAEGVAHEGQPAGVAGERGLRLVPGVLRPVVAISEHEIRS